MVMPPLAEPWTRQAVLALPDDGNRYELIAGELLVTPSPRSVHQDAVSGLAERIGPWVRTHRLGHLSHAPADLEIRPGELYQPDLFVVPLVQGRKPLDWKEYRTPLLVIEVSSPSTARYDRVVKRPAFQDAGVGEYWIVDLDARLVERWLPSDTRPEIAVGRLVWRPTPDAPSLEINLPALFSEVWGEP